MARRVAFNPFYLLVVAAGVAFFITACAYGVMALRSFQLPSAGAAAAAPSALMDWLDLHGTRLMLSEVAVLGVGALAAMATDSYWTHLSARRRQRGLGVSQEEFARDRSHGEETGR